MVKIIDIQAKVNPIIVNPILAATLLKYNHAQDGGRYCEYERVHEFLKLEPIEIEAKIKEHEENNYVIDMDISEKETVEVETESVNIAIDYSEYWSKHENITGAARKLAISRNVNIHKVEATGNNGAITISDIRKAITN